VSDHDLHEAESVSLDLYARYKRLLKLKPPNTPPHYFEAQIDAEAIVLKKLRAGTLVAWGFRRGAPFNQGRVEVHPTQWEQLEPDFQNSSASLLGQVELTGIVIAEAPALMRTGGPGRPTTISLVIAEYGRRRDAGECCATLADEARALQQWFRLSYPREHLLATGTIENNLRNVGFQRRKLSTK